MGKKNKVEKTIKDLAGESFTASEKDSKFLKAEKKSKKQKLKEKLLKAKIQNKYFQEVINDLKIMNNNLKSELKKSSEEEVPVKHELYPVTIIADRYNGFYSKGMYTAWNLENERVPWQITANQNICKDWWDNYYNTINVASNDMIAVGIGNTIKDAIEDLKARINRIRAIKEYAGIDPETDGTLIFNETHSEDKEENTEDNLVILKQYNAALESVIDKVGINPLTILIDTYNGKYSGGKYIACNWNKDNIPSDMYQSEKSAKDFWNMLHDDNDLYHMINKYIGVGNTPIEAVLNLRYHQKDKNESSTQKESSTSKPLDEKTWDEFEKNFEKFDKDMKEAFGDHYQTSASKTIKSVRDIMNQRHKESPNTTSFTNTSSTNIKKDVKEEVKKESPKEEVKKSDQLKDIPPCDSSSLPGLDAEFDPDVLAMCDEINDCMNEAEENNDNEIPPINSNFGSNFPKFDSVSFLMDEEIDEYLKKIGMTKEEYDKKNASKYKTNNDGKSDKEFYKAREKGLAGIEKAEKDWEYIKNKKGYKHVNPSDATPNSIFEERLNSARKRHPFKLNQTYGNGVTHKQLSEYQSNVSFHTNVYSSCVFGYIPEIDSNDVIQSIKNTVSEHLTDDEIYDMKHDLKSFSCAGYCNYENAKDFLEYYSTHDINEVCDKYNMDKSDIISMKNECLEQYPELECLFDIADEEIENIEDDPLYLKAKEFIIHHIIYGNEQTAKKYNIQTTSIIQKKNFYLKKFPILNEYYNSLEKVREQKVKEFLEHYANHELLKLSQYNMDHDILSTKVENYLKKYPHLRYIVENANPYLDKNDIEEKIKIFNQKYPDDEDNMDIIKSFLEETGREGKSESFYLMEANFNVPDVEVLRKRQVYLKKLPSEECKWEYGNCHDYYYSYMIKFFKEFAEIGVKEMAKKYRESENDIRDTRYNYLREFPTFRFVFPDLVSSTKNDELHKK